MVELIMSDSAKGDSRHNPLDPLTDRFLGPNGLSLPVLLCPIWIVEHDPHSETTVARMLVGNKSDLENIRDVSVEEGKSLAEAEGLFFIETSALDSTNVKKAFEIVIREIYNNISRKVLNSDSYKAELSVNRISLVSNGADGAKQANSSSVSPTLQPDTSQGFQTVHQKGAFTTFFTKKRVPKVHQRWLSQGLSDLL
ncbi:Ras-related protein RABA5c [Vitis vinifera]|uniref:Ras-related protein RABA5c n=1 Tax=Vitis vinifera TaxID=29760 RepID=A0A438D6J7_VITVI|nr:Ras-related protein RABA5c [Vitis vinifera]